MSKKKRSLLLICLFIAAFVVVGITISVKQSSPSYTSPSGYFEYPDVKKYYEERADIISVTPVKKYKKTYSEKEVIAELEYRGFTNYPITVEYSFNGEFGDEMEITSESTDKHPVYQTYYINSSGIVWSIKVVGDKINAIPVSYNTMDSKLVPITVSENAEILSYDCTTNSYYLTIPYKNVMGIRIVEKISAETLDTYTTEALSNG